MKKLKILMTLFVVFLFVSQATGQLGREYRQSLSARLYSYGTSIGTYGYIGVQSSHQRFVTASGVNMHFHAGVGIGTTAPLVLTSAGGTLTGNLAVTGTLTQTGAMAASGGITLPTMTTVISAVGGTVVSATVPGTDVAAADGNRFWTEIQIPYNITLTGAWYLVGSVGGTDSVVIDLYSSTGVLVASTDSLASQQATIVGTAAQVQKVAFNGTYAAVAGKYFISVQFNGTTAKFRGYGVAGSPFIAGSAAGTFRTAAAITPGTTFTADKGPVSGVY